jgi:hypothetical protein
MQSASRASCSWIKYVEAALEYTSDPFLRFILSPCRAAFHDQCLSLSIVSSGAFEIRFEPKICEHGTGTGQLSFTLAPVLQPPLSRSANPQHVLHRLPFILTR